MKYFYVIGNPVNHSLSPRIFTYIFNKLNINARYSIYCPSNKIELKCFVKNRMNDFSGINITSPYKIESYNLIGGKDKFSNKVNAINCIKNINNTLIGYNTDYYGFNKMLDKIDLYNHEILILGNGATARTVIYSLIEYSNNQINIWGRSKDKVEMFIKGIDSKNLRRYLYPSNKSYIVFNCLPVNIKNDFIENIINELFPSNVELFVDLNYIETLFTKKLIEKKYNVLLGLDMFIFQALKSFDIWFDNKYQNKITYNEIKNVLNK